MNKVGQERRSRAELESRISHLEYELELVTDKLSQSEYKLSLRENQLHFNSDSENEEFLNTIEAQKLQILTEKENFAQLQHILEVVRGRGKREAVHKQQGEAVQMRLSKINNDLEKERDYRRSIESSVNTDDVGRIIIKQLQKDLQYERDKTGQLDSDIAKERQKYNDLYVEYKYLKNSSPVVSSETGYKFASHRDSEKYLRDKNFELEQYNSELELKIENTEREAVGRHCHDGVRAEGGADDDIKSYMSTIHTFQKNLYPSNSAMQKQNRWYPQQVFGDIVEVFGDIVDPG